MTDDLHVDSYAINHDAGAGEPFVRLDVEPLRSPPSPLGLRQEAERYGSYWPHSNGYAYETRPHGDGECGQHLPTGTWVRYGSMAEVNAARDVLASGDPIVDDEMSYLNPLESIS